MVVRDPRAGLVRIRDLAGRPRGTGFLADDQGTLITSHEAVEGLDRLVLNGDFLVTADDVTPLPELGLALVRTDGLGLDPLPVTVRDRIPTGTEVWIAAGHWRQARVLGATDVTYTATDRPRHLHDALELAIGTAGQDALRPGGGASGGPVLDAATGTVLGVLGTALRSDHRDTGFAIPPRSPAGPLAELLARNAATVPAYGPDLNLAGVLELTATATAAAMTQDGTPGTVEPAERPATAAALDAFASGPGTVLRLVGAPGSGRTTELAALAARHSRGTRKAPTLWLRGTDLKDTDDSVADAVQRTLTRVRDLTADDLTAEDLTADDLARVAGQAGRPLLILLDGSEGMPPALADRTPAWTERTGEWLREHGARLVVACREEFREECRGDTGTPPLRLTGLTPDEARLARSRYEVPDDTLTGQDARHPLTLRLLSEVRAAQRDAPDAAGLDRHDVFSAYLDLMCLRIAVRLAAENGTRGTAVRRLAARVAGQVHGAARRGLGSERGDLDRRSFEELFPRGTAPARLGGGSGWASAVLAEGLLVQAGDGYRFAHEEFADWIQGLHLDLDDALRTLVHPPGPPSRLRAGPVAQALLLLGRRHGACCLAPRLEQLIHALDADPDAWWPARLLARTLLGVPDATPYTGVLSLLADRIVVWRRRKDAVPAEFGPAFWTALTLPDTERHDLLRRLVLADEAPAPGSGGRYLDAVARLLAADPAAVQPQLTRWFADERPLPATPHATVATAAQALLHTHRHGALDALTEVLVDSAHPRADELLAVLAEDETSVVCRAVDRWAHDPRPARRAAAVTHGLHAAPHLRTDAHHALLRHAALTLLTRPADHALHGGALALLVRDPHTRARHLPAALRHFAAGDPRFPASALAPALATDPDPVLDAFRARLRTEPDVGKTGEALRALAEVTTPALARRISVLVRETAELRPETAAHVAAYVDRGLDQGPAVRAVLLPLVTGLLADGPEPVRAALAAVLGAPGTPASRPLRRELLEYLLDHEREPAVLDAVPDAVPDRAARDGVRVPV